MAVLSVILQCLPPIFLTPWYMRIDLVAVPWIICWFLFGFKPAFLSLLLSIPLVGLLGPFAGGWVGAIMKSVASMWMILIPEIARYASKGNYTLPRYTLSVLVAVMVRALACVLFNLYFAIPIFFGMSPSDVIAFFSNPRFQSFVGLSLGLIGLTAYVVEVSFWNIVQGIIDAYASFLIYLAIVKRLCLRQITS